MSTNFRTFIGDAERDLTLTPIMVLELERLTGMGIGALMSRVTHRQFHHADLLQIIRLGLIGGGEAPERAAQFVQIYVAPRPISEILPGAIGALEALWFGSAPQEENRQ
ncbi:hypothetical protein FHS85_001948 [Rhodoligotrophos appendicifer]|uniref:gene transfer agent family protein n=1 Tax=Rhodoligotrophos appendicifer TaxID=987056 RepID=UPI001185C482|nr:gene transfer agent family protein [Rhodoligotrophos appendicifer]